MKRLSPSTDAADFFAVVRVQNEERRAAVVVAVPALARLCDVMAHKTGQGYTLRALLYSLWNGQPTTLLEIVGLDWPIRQDLALVLLAFGDDSFFYDAIKSALNERGLFDWFVAESEVES